MINGLVVWIMCYRMIVYVYWIVYKNGQLNWFGVWNVLIYDDVDYMNIHVEEWIITVLEWGQPLAYK